MTIGHRLGSQTAFQDIELLPVGSRARLSQGKLSFEPLSGREQYYSSANAVRGAEIIKEAASRCFTAVPDCAIELSGGLDSRMVLAAIPPDLRRGRIAHTIGYEGTPDVTVARDLADKCGLDHHFINLAQNQNEGSDVTWKRAESVACRDDFSSNILDRLAIDCVDDHLLTCTRFGGVNGEICARILLCGASNLCPGY